ncbi:alpha/beta hydrolase [Bacillus taeanensis]|uniref:Alpha/beta hydrolase n=1 Tax=Bacillus taeanensis TaxID=273032 RepID=A0A366Y0M7_9BACI|nr:alpha/beta hydrolase [Bacillus taeanensis]RBW71398.1 alpha/beta hydrolase [Bacillus taeanensis]
MWKWEVSNAKGVFVIVHGAGEHHGRYSWLVEKWNEEGFHVIMGDLPGQGTTTRRRGHIDSFNDYIETVAGWVEQAEQYKLPIYLLGHSMGGLVVIRTLMEKDLPIEVVLLSSPCLGLVRPPSKGKQALAKVLNVFSPAVRFPSNLEPGTATRNEDVLQKDAEDPLYVRKVSVRWYRELEKAMEIVHTKIEKFPDMPLLLLQAGDDRICDKERAQEWFNRLLLREKAYKEWEGLFHEVFNEPEREEVFQYAKSFMVMRQL